MTTKLPTVRERVDALLERLDERSKNEPEFKGAKVFAETLLSEIGTTLTSDRTTLCEVLVELVNKNRGTVFGNDIISKEDAVKIIKETLTENV